MSVGALRRLQCNELVVAGEVHVLELFLNFVVKIEFLQIGFAVDDDARAVDQTFIKFVPAVGNEALVCLRPCDLLIEASLDGVEGILREDY